MATRHSSSRQRPSRRLAGDSHPKSSRSKSQVPKPPRTRTAEEPAKRPDLDEILGNFNKALALVETAHAALEIVDETGEGVMASAMLTFGRGLESLHRTYKELDLAIPHYRGNAS